MIDRARRADVVFIEAVADIDAEAVLWNEAGAGAGYLQAIVAGEVGKALNAGAERATPMRTQFNPNLDPEPFSAVMQLIISMTMLGVVLVGAAVIRESEHGALEHLLVMPLGAFEVMTAKVWANGAVILVAAALSLYVMVEGFLGVPAAGSSALFIGGAALYVFAVTFLSILLATIARTMPQFRACVVCRTDLHVVDGDLSARRSPIIPYHEIIGIVDALGAGVDTLAVGQRVGVPWLHSTCGACRFCRSDRENPCDAGEFTGYARNGGFAEYVAADSRYCFAIPERYSDQEAAPLMCAGQPPRRRLSAASDFRSMLTISKRHRILLQIVFGEGFT